MNGSDTPPGPLSGGDQRNLYTSTPFITCLERIPQHWALIGGEQLLEL
ncbi:MAG TPA: hypothetical protein PKI66_05500 [Methanobacteriaceae archaeon]|nr:hypothetical protein [Methanobacteriaceae archaeon]HNS25571.1 hypothetical protein [Methanobacteriaceae archaeon]